MIYKEIRKTLSIFLHEVLKREKALKEKYYHDGISNQTKRCVIFQIDGREIHGGLADRLKGIISIYSFCKECNIPYYINFKYPFNLIDYLCPNKVNWSIAPDEIIYSLNDSAPVIINDFQIPRKLHKLYFRIRLLRYKQLHVYSNSPYAIKHFPKLFKDLFKPSFRLQKDIDDNLQKIGARYISATFRFQQLLGDFKERDFPILSDIEQQELVAKCHEQLNKLHINNPNSVILVTADSGKFLESIKDLSYIYVIPGKVVHMDYTENMQFEVYEKSFLDFFLIAKAEKIYLIYNSQMYRSGFPSLAARVYEKPYIELKF